MITLTDPEARHALTEAVFHMSKMRARVAADARVTSGARCIFRVRAVSLGAGVGVLGFIG